MNKYEQTTLKKKDSVLRSALNLFSLSSYGKVTMKDIAKESGVSQASIYNYFGSKEEIIDSIVNEWIRKLNDDVKSILDSDCSFTEKIEEVLTLCDNELGAQINKLVEDSNDLRFIDLVKFYVNKNKQLVYKQVLKEGKATNDIDDQISDKVYLRFIEAINEVVFESKDELEQIKRMVLHGILK